MDAFFASIEERNRPHLKGKPIAVGSDPNEGLGRGVVSTANYKAREYGIHSAMPISRAWKASEKAKSEGKTEVVFLPVNFEAYEKSSAAVLSIIRKYSETIEQASVDEFYFDLSAAGSFKKAEDICKKIKKEIGVEEKVTCSVGVGPNKLIAKIAAGKKKPDGLMVVEEKEVESFLEPLSVREIPGIGPKTAALLAEQKVLIVKDLRKFSLEELENMLGKWGIDIYYKARGIDNSIIETSHEVKSIGEQNTFQEDTFDAVLIASELEKYCKSVFRKFLESGFSHFKTIAITIRFSDFQTITSAKSFKPEMGKKDLKKFKLEALKLLLPFLDKRKNPKLKHIRLIGVRIEKLLK